MPDLTITHHRATWHIHLDRAGDDHIVTRLATGSDGRDIATMAAHGSPEWERAVGLALRAEAFRASSSARGCR